MVQLQVFGRAVIEFLELVGRVHLDVMDEAVDTAAWRIVAQEYSQSIVVYRAGVAGDQEVQDELAKTGHVAACIWN